MSLQYENGIDLLKNLSWQWSAGQSPGNQQRQQRCMLYIARECLSTLYQTTIAKATTTNKKKEKAHDHDNARFLLSFSSCAFLSCSVPPRQFSSSQSTSSFSSRSASSLFLLFYSTNLFSSYNGYKRGGNIPSRSVL